MMEMTTSSSMSVKPRERPARATRETGGRMISDSTKKGFGAQVQTHRKVELTSSNRTIPDEIKFFLINQTSVGSAVSELRQRGAGEEDAAGPGGRDVRVSVSWRA